MAPSLPGEAYVALPVRYRRDRRRIMFLMACGGLAPHASREERLRAALRAGDWQQAQEQLSTASGAQWHQETEALVQRHGALRIVAFSGGRDGFPPGLDRREAIYRLTFADGYERCLWVGGRGGGNALDVLRGGYVDCATIPAPEVRFGTPSPRDPANSSCYTGRA